MADFKANCYPLLFKRILVEKVWGGNRISKQLGEELPFDGPLGETWELSDYPGKETEIRNGHFAGQSLRALMEQYGSFILGDSRASDGGRFPLLVKLLDAGDNLSVQVHPPDGEKSPTGIGKTEAWYVLDSAENASLICGLKRGTSYEQFAEDAPTSKIRDYLVEFPVQEGDCVYVPSGQTHAICAGTVLCEIQQTSDVTFRLYDWDRLGLDGKPRKTHLKESLEAINFDLSPSAPQRHELSSPVYQGESVSLCGGDYFAMYLHRHGSEGEIVAQKNVATLLVVIAGRGVIQPLDDSFKPLEVSFGDTVLIPACLEGVKVCGVDGGQIDFIRAVAR
jgi:mannose-6-phosphate isomerase